MTSHFEQHGVAEIRDELVALRGHHVYLKLSGDADPLPYQGLVTEVDAATTVIVNEPEPELGQSAIRERSRVRIDHILSVSEVAVVRDEPDDNTGSHGPVEVEHG